jgi:hypothetical protein
MNQLLPDTAPDHAVTPAPDEPFVYPPPDPPMRDANVIRLFRSPPGIGLWFARLGPQDGSDRRAIQYGPSGSRETAHAFLLRFVGYLSRAGHQFDDHAIPEP